MTIREFYDFVGGDYAGTMGRMLKEERIKKYLLRLLDNKDYNECINAFADKNYEVAFRASHNLKGMSLNLGLTKLAKSSSELCETVRNGVPSVDTAPLMKAMQADYEKTVTAIRNNLM